MVRVKPAAAMRCFISLVVHLTKRTPFRKQIRLCKISLSLERFFHDTANIKEARHQAEHFLERRLRRLFPDMSPEESREIKLRGAKMIDDIEQQTLTERQQAVDAKRQEQAASEEKSKATAHGGDELELTEDERQQGVQIGRVESRVGGHAADPTEDYAR